MWQSSTSWHQWRDTTHTTYLQDIFCINSYLRLSLDSNYIKFIHIGTYINHVSISIPVKACCSILMRAMVVFMPLPCSTVQKICHWSRSLLFGKQWTMIIQYSKHIMLLASFFFQKEKRTNEKQQPQLLSRRYPQMGTERNCGPVTSHQH